MSITNPLTNYNGTCVLGTNHKCADYQSVLIFQVSLYDKASFETITKCVNYAGVYIQVSD